MNTNNTYAANITFNQQRILNHVPRDLEEERLALQRLNRMAPDLVAMVLGGVL
jgi:pyoverdine/dityrosine biosynthesis protein Dit1